MSVSAQKRLSDAVCRRLMLTGDVVDSRDALKIGLIDFVGSNSEVNSEIQRLTQRFNSIYLQNPSLLIQAKKNCPAPSLEKAMVIMGDLHTDRTPGGLMSSELVKVTKPRPELAVVELNDPNRANAMDEEMAAQFRARVEELKADPQLKAVLLLGTYQQIFSSNLRVIPLEVEL